MGKIYFASDFHLTPETKERELRIVKWLDSIKHDAEAIYLVGDIFDFWFEYKKVIPKGYIRFFGKLAELRNANIPIYFFTGNHDMWMFDYFEKELNIPIYRSPIIKEIRGKTFYIGHGDGLGPGDYGYKMLKKVFANPFCQWLFARLHPNFGIGLAERSSKKSRDSQDLLPFQKEEEWLYIFANEQLDRTYADYFIFGHRHLTIDMKLKNGISRYINLGEWFSLFSYAVFDEELSIQYFDRQGVTHQY